MLLHFDYSAMNVIYCIPYPNSIYLLKNVRWKHVQYLLSFSDVQPHLYAAPRPSGAAFLLKLRLQLYNF